MGKKKTTYLETLDRLDEQRRLAFKEKKAVDYFHLCNQLGVEPEDLDLYGQGIMELKYSEKMRKNLTDKLNEGVISLRNSKPYVPTTIVGLKMEIRKNYHQRGMSLPKGFSRWGRKERKKLTALYFYYKGL